MSVIGCHALVWTGTFEREGLIRAVDRTHHAGYDLLELPLLRPFEFYKPIVAAVNAINAAL